MDGQAQCSSQASTSNVNHRLQTVGHDPRLPLPVNPVPVNWVSTPWVHLNPDPDDVEHISRSAPPSAVAELPVPSFAEHTDPNDETPSSRSPLLSQSSDSGHLTRRSSPASSSWSKDFNSCEYLPSHLCGHIQRHHTQSTSSDQLDDVYYPESRSSGQTLQFDRPPNPAQRILATNSISARQLRLAALDMHVAAAHTAVLEAQERERVLLAQRAVLSAQIHRDQNRLQPALYLPIETLAEIFSYCVTEDAHALWKISSVCFDWRVAALAYPRLWCRIIIPSHLPPLDQVRISRLWVERTSTVEGLDIRYRAVDDSVRYSTNHFEEIMITLASQIHRWRHFDLETNLDDCVHICLRLSTGYAPNLETFLVRESESPATRRNRRVLPCRNLTLGPAPSLKHVVLYTSAWPTATFLRGLTTLTLVSGRPKRMSDLWNVLEACEELERLTLRLPMDREIDPPMRSRPPLQLNHLHSLSGNTMVLTLLHHLLVPALDTLQVNDVDAYALMRTLNVLDLRSNPPLHTLRLRNCRLVSGTTGLSLKSIKRLEFYDSEVDDNFFLSLSMPTAGTSSWIRPYRTWALPSLEVVVLRRAHYVREEALRRLVEARNPTTPNAMCPGGTPAVGLPARVKMVDVKECRRVRAPFSDWIQERLGRVSDRFLVSCGSASGEKACSNTSHGYPGVGSPGSLGAGLAVAPLPQDNNSAEQGETLDVEVESDII